MFNPPDITTKEDLIKILSKCQRCLQSTLNGDLIISIDQLPLLILKKHSKQNKLNLIINTKSDGTTGHWFNLSIFDKNHIFLCDGLNEVTSNQNILEKINHFIINNKLKLYDFKIRYQPKTSKKCGYLACFQVYKSNTMNRTKFIKFRKMLLRNSITTNEKLMIARMKSHFMIT